MLKIRGVFSDIVYVVRDIESAKKLIAMGFRDGDILLVHDVKQNEVEEIIRKYKTVYIDESVQNTIKHVNTYIINNGQVVRKRRIRRNMNRDPEIGM